MVDQNSPGVNAREIDLTGPRRVEPVGIPAGVVGTAIRGPAFVPVTVGTYADFRDKFGGAEENDLGVIAAAEWLRNSRALTYLRILGAGRGLRRETSGDSAGRVRDAGFIVGQEMFRDSDGAVEANPYANANGILGRTYFLGAFMSESAGSTFFSDAGIQSGPTAHPILRGVLLAASGVALTLSASNAADSSAPTSSTVAVAGGPLGALSGTVDLTTKDFVMLLNGHDNSDPAYPTAVTASFDPTSTRYFGNIFNRDPFKLQDAGYVLYNHYDIHSSVAVVTGTGLMSSTGSEVVNQELAFMTYSSLSRNSGSSTIPNFENFEDRFAAAETPYVISQRFGGNPQDLFKFVMIHDGADATGMYKVSISNITPGATNEFGTFDVVFRDLRDSDEDPVVVEAYRGLTLDPRSERYIGRVIGDTHVYFDFDKKESAQRIVVDGRYPNRSNNVRVVVSSAVENGEVDTSTLPMGFRGPKHLVTSGSSILTSIVGAESSGSWDPTITDMLNRAVEPPIPFRLNITKGTTPTQTVSPSLHWGVQFELRDSISEPNKSTLRDKTIDSFAKYFPKFHTVWQNAWVGENAGAADSSGTILDSDRFNNNVFSLEHVRVTTGSNGRADATDADAWVYVRNGSVGTSETNKTRALKTSDLGDSAVRSYAKFSFFFQGGFDGTNMFDRETSALTNTAVYQEINNSTRGQNNGPTVRTYRKALDVIENKTNMDIQLFAIPGIRDAIVTDRAITMVENRFDALFIMDVDQRDESNNTALSSSQAVSVTNTVQAHRDRALDSSFMAAYFPDAVVQNPDTRTVLQVPPSVVTLGAYALNDAIGFPWFAPAGFTRGALPTTQELAVGLGQENLNALYEADINPLVSFPGQGPKVFGQKTAQAKQTSLDRVNVRRLLITLRREIRALANRLLFEPNRETTLAQFKRLVDPVVQRVKENRGIERYKVLIDTTTTTEADIENNTIRGKIYVQPTATAEFVSLDFEVTNAGEGI